MTNKQTRRLDYLMKKAIKVAIANLRQEVAERLYVAFRIDFTRPIQIIGLITERCNARCEMCHYWRQTDYPSELPAEDWIEALDNLRKFAPGFHIQFTGGEPLMKRDFMQILQWCGQNGVSAGFVTNGELITKDIAKQIVACRINNVNFSIDSATSELHDKLRGKDGIFNRAISAIGYLRLAAEKENRNFIISIKPTLHSLNMLQMPQLLENAREWGATVVNIQPISVRTPEGENMWITDIPALRKVIDKLSEMKKQGFPLANTQRQMATWIGHFEGKTLKRKGACKVGMRMLSILSNGDAYYCSTISTVIGNIADSPIKQIWKGDTAREVRFITAKCKLTCTASCYSERTFIEKANFFSEDVFRQTF